MDIVSKVGSKIQDKISYKVLPKPHLLIKKATLDLNKKDAKSSIIETKSLGDGVLLLL